MPISTIKHAETKWLQVISEDGVADESLLPGVPDSFYKKLYEAIVRARTFNRTALSLQREGRIGTYPSIYGQEASQIGSALAFDDADWFVTSFRETGVFLAKGYPMHLMLRYWMGDERGMKCPEGLNFLPMAVPVGSQIVHAAGIGMAINYKGEKKAVAAYFGDGGSSRGDFHEGLNFSGVFKTPVVFLCQNNQWAISVPRARQTAGTTIAERGSSYGLPCVQVDGNDAVAVYRATAEAVARAKSGQGATLIECFTYRLDDHTTSDDASRYRQKAEVAEWLKKEPFIRLRAFMTKRGLANDEYETSVAKAADEEVRQAVKEAEAIPNPDPGDVLRYTYAELTGRQKKELKDNGWDG